MTLALGPGKDMLNKVRVLVVDDSGFFRRRIRADLEATGEIEVVGEAANGEEAVQMTVSLAPDLVTMDVAMPVLDGIAAVRAIMRQCPTPVIMFSALTQDGARATLDALDAGAVDFLTKLGSGGSHSSSHAGSGEILRERVLSIARNRHQRGVRAAVAPRPQAPPESARRRRLQDLRLVVIGASTGGPVAVQQVLSSLPADFAYPVLVAVHMPSAFTSTFAERLNGLCALHVREAVNGELLRRGDVLIAQGGVQTLVEGPAERLHVRVRPANNELYRPSVDLCFDSAARAVGAGVLGIVLTGMGADGAQGAASLKRAGSYLWAQDQASCVVYGMPQAVAKAGLVDRVLALAQIGPELAGVG